MTTGKTALIALGLALAAAPAWPQASTQAKPTQPNWWSAPAREDGPPRIVWAGRKSPDTPYTGPNRPLWRIADILKAHAGRQSWDQQVLLNRDFDGHYISMAPGEKTKTQFYADDRVFWVVQSGQMKVTIEGQEPFIASKHFLIQIPKRLQYSMETVGNEPSLRFEMRPAGESPDYPLSETPTPVKGVQYIKAVYSGHGDYDGKVNVPYVDFEKQIVQGGEKRGVWLRDDHNYVTILRSQMACPRRPTMSGAIITPTSRKSG